MGTATAFGTTSSNNRYRTVSDVTFNPGETWTAEWSNQGRLNQR